MQVTLRRARQANRIIKLGLKFNDKVGEGRRVEVIPCVCYNCQEVDARHIATNCPNETTCLGCGGNHNHRTCGNYNRHTYYCKNCDMRGDHGPGSKDCPKYQEARMRIEAKVPGNGSEYYEDTDEGEEAEEVEEDEWETERSGGETGERTQMGITATAPIDKQWRKKEKRRKQRESKKARDGIDGGSSTEETDDDEMEDLEEPRSEKQKTFTQLTLSNETRLRDANGGNLGSFSWATDAERQQEESDAARHGWRKAGTVNDNNSTYGSEKQ
ncbi:hypothetical protein CVT24_012913 [Panaeolus cyanescens]|uniref:CCHC-type domain-containing protein n=1 Tax=Panaeolus cyanescens TaxID=181874 RepID=A0A409XAT6_9AGAR|nr:hypothetical protein CVT24_012913 [Panaeolus cyanescens]